MASPVTRLDNDGVHAHWLAEGDVYRLHHDGAHWQVTDGSWFQEGHVYRLTRGGRPIGAIPTLDGDVGLSPACGYLIRQDETGDWLLSRCG